MLTPNIPRPNETKDQRERRILAGRQDLESELQYQARLAADRKKKEIEAKVKDDVKK